MLNVGGNPAIVVEVIDDHTIVINRGSAHGVRKGERFLVYSVRKKEIIDPITKGSLGHLEINKGTGRVISVQDQMAIIESDKRQNPERKIIRRIKKPQVRDDPGFVGVAFSHYQDSHYQEEEEIIEIPKGLVPFKSPKIGDKVKPI